jgi:hypothetical protein
VEEMMADIRVSFMALVHHAKWIDEDTRNHALRKLRAMGQLIAYPEFYFERGYIEEQYRGVSTIVSYLKHSAKQTKTRTTTTNYMLSTEFMNSCTSVNVFRPPTFFVKEIKVIIPNNRLVISEGSSLLNKPVSGHGLVQFHPPPTFSN